MQTSTAVKPHSNKWVYVSLAVIDGERRIRPAQVGPDQIIFREPPGLISEKVQIIVTNGDDQNSRYARVLPHNPQDVRIPIELLPAQ